jgi:hypothetical protein
MSDDEDYYEWEEDYPFEDLVPDLVVSPYHLCRSCGLGRSGGAKCLVNV